VLDLCRKPVSRGSASISGPREEADDGRANCSRAFRRTLNPGTHLGVCQQMSVKAQPS